MKYGIEKQTDVNWKQLKTLLEISIRMDFRGTRRAGKGGRISPIVLSIIVNGLMGGVLAGGLISSASQFIYSLLMLAYSMVMTAFAVILELNGILLNPEDSEILAHRPIGFKTYFYAKLGNLLFFVLLLGTAVSLLPAFIGLAVGETGWLFPAGFLFMSTIANLAAASFVILIYTGLLKLMTVERFKNLLAAVQIGFAFLLFFSYQLLPEAVRSSSFLNGGESSKIWLYFVPPAWFAGGVQILTGLAQTIHFQLVLMAFAVTIFFACFAFRKIASQYFQLMMQLEHASGSVDACRADNRGIHRAVEYQIRKRMASPEAAAGFQLASDLIRRERSIQMIVYPVLGMPLAILVLGVIKKKIVDPFLFHSFSAGNELSAAILFSLFFMIYFFMTGINTSRDWDASWIFYSAPIVSPGRFSFGVRLAVFIRLILPFFILFGIFYCTQIFWVHGLQHTLTLFLFSLVALSTAAWINKTYPFSTKRERGERTRRFAGLFFIAPFWGFSLLCISFAYKSPLRWLMMQGVSLLVLFIMEILTIRKMDRILGQNEFFG